MRNKQLNKAKREKNDEFYTQRPTIIKEVLKYRQHFKDKVVLCNCDDPEWSEFFKFFKERFDDLGLKGLITTAYNEGERGAKKIIHTKQGPGPIGRLKGDGDFRSEECIKLLKQADIVVTNPPFSLFREYVEQLVEYDKKFIIIGSLNAITYQEIFPLIKENKIWLGVSPSGITFDTPNGEQKHMGFACWFTNLSHAKRNEELFLNKRYDPDLYPKYDNYDAINVDRVKNIPKDYYEPMGVPITFLTHFCPEQFKIVGAYNVPVVKGKGIYKRLLIKRKENN